MARQSWENRTAYDPTAEAARVVLTTGAAAGATAGDATTPLAVTAPARTGTNRSVTATTTSAQLMAANTSRSKFFIQNDTAIDCFINFGATAVAAAGNGNLKIAAGRYFEFTGSSAAVNIIAASATADITAREF